MERGDIEGCKLLALRVVLLRHGFVGYRGQNGPTDLTRRANQFAFRFALVQPLTQKYFCFSEMKIGLYDSPSRPARGALAIVTNVGAGSGGRGSARAQA